MAKINLTNNQKEAVYHRGGDVLVSAAAGSGKTSVLAKRVAAQVMEGVDIRRMLVLTFTNAAAAEMRTRIARELEELAEEHGDSRLAKQAEEAGAADICTMHSFSIKLIRENYSALGVSGDIRAAGEEETAVLRANAMEAMFAMQYEVEDARFLMLRNRFAGRTDDALKQLILQIFAYAQSQPEGTRWISGMQELDVDAYLDVAHEMIVGNLEQLCGTMQACLELEREALLPERQYLNNKGDYELSERLYRLFFEDQSAYEELLKTANIPAIARGIEPEQVKATLSTYKKEGRKCLKELKGQMPSVLKKRLEGESAYIKELVQALFHVVCAFEEQYALEKQEARVMDYDDMIAWAVRLLGMDEIRETYEGRYDAVFVDEYQDTNPIQESLITKLAPEQGHFMVGDIKQSIYRFRLADPLIFKEKSALLADAPKGKTIYMNENFRSAPQVIDAVNWVMDVLMSEPLGEIEYDAGERLKAGLDGAEGGVELLLTDHEGTMEDHHSATEKEAHTIARRILELLQERGQDGAPKYEPQDICILLRNMEGNGRVIASVLQSYGILAQLPTGRVMEGAEVEVFVNLLRVIDGYFSDVALLSVMRSHIGGFVEAEMAAIRSVDREKPFRACIHTYSEGKSALAEKCGEFLAKVGRYRELSRSLLLEDFLLLLKNETNYEAYAAILPGGKERLEQFELFFAQCIGYAGGRHSLHGLVGQLEAIKRQLGTYGGSGQFEAGGFVQIMSIHRSKGLEYPVVFLARTATRFSNRDSAKPVLLHNVLGITADRINERKRTKATPLSKELMRYQLEKEMKSEELRLLYVAMTRAKERLILSSMIRKPEQVLPALAEKQHWYEFLSMRSMSEWLLAALLKLPCMEDWAGKQSEPDKGSHIQIYHERIPSFAGYTAPERSLPSKGDVLREAAALPCQPFLSYEIEPIPAKLGVSALLPQDDVGAPLPAYTTGGDAGAELGTLIHLFMQHMPLSMSREEELLETADGMVQKKILSPYERDRIGRFYPQICTFLRSDIVKRAKASKELYRELAFSLSVAANEIGISASSSTMVLQGIIDMVFLEEDGWVLVDYKSNMTDQAGMQALAQRYRTQIKAYELAMERITGKKVKESWLWFLRMDQKFQIF